MGVSVHKTAGTASSVRPDDNVRPRPVPFHAILGITATVETGRRVIRGLVGGGAPHNKGTCISAIVSFRPV